MERKSDFWFLKFFPGFFFALNLLSFDNVKFNVCPARNTIIISSLSAYLKLTFEKNAI